MPRYMIVIMQMFLCYNGSKEIYLHDETTASNADQHLKLDDTVVIYRGEFLIKATKERLEARDIQ